MTHLDQDTSGVLVEPRASTAATVTVRDVVTAYVGLTKPRVIELLLLTTVPVMFAAAGGIPTLGLVIATVAGGALSAGSASALNCVYDRDIDEQMRRTRRRALPRHVVSAPAAVTFGVVLGVAATLILWVWVNPLSAMLALAAEVFYLVVYTVWLKRRTTQNIVWGGVAGCFPTLIGWTAVTGEIGWPPLVLFLVVFFWTPPHTWALALRYRDDYAVVSVPMLPAVAPASVVGRQIVIYSWATVLTSVGYWWVAEAGVVYLVTALCLGVVFVAAAHGLWGRTRRSDDLAELAPMRLFHLSNLYLALLFVAVAVDPVLGRIA
ncbi:MAG: heme o synthase [Nocardioides sp.]